ncbi:MAG: tetratricopeptide repeat protein [Planctomycetes bacterium]|nr:tetratricopeptide repeat protein [Planctomycetota bacterium]
MIAPRTSLRLSLCGLAVAFTAAAQESSLQDLSKKCGDDIPWIQDEGPRDRSNRNELLDQALTRAKEQNRLVMWYVYRVDRTPFWKPEHLDRYMLTGPFADGEISELIRRKFVPLRMTATASVGKKYDVVVRKFAFLEPGLVFLTPEGEAVHKMDRLRSLSPDFLLNTLRLVLEKNASFNSPSESTRKAKERAAEPEGKLDLAREHVMDGDYAEAEKLLEQVLPAAKSDLLGRAHVVRAMLHRRRFEFEAALKSLEAASPHLATPASKGEALSEKGLVLLKLAKFDDAKKAYEQALKEAPQAPRAAESAYQLGVCEYLTANDSKAKEIWARLAETSPDSPWAWKGAASARKVSDCYLGDSALARGFEDPVCPPAAALAELRTGSEWPREAKDVQDVGRRAVEFLLRRQREDGSWSDSRYIFQQGPVILPNVWVSITALSCAALLEWRAVDPKRIDAALEKGMKYMRDAGDLARGKFETCYADSYRLLYLSRRAAAFPKEKEALVKEMNEVVEKLTALQSKQGWWAHEYPNPFATGTALTCLGMARKAGATVTDETLQKGVDALKGCMQRDGTYPYSTRGPSSKKDAAGRMVNCELGRKQAGEGSDENLARAVETFLDVHPRWERVRKTGFHADGQLGGFFFFYSFHPATEAALLLDAEKRGSALKRFLEILLNIAEIDGSFGEDPTMGKSFSTAMGLLALKNCVTD